MLTLTGTVVGQETFTKKTKQGQEFQIRVYHVVNGAGGRPASFTAAKGQEFKIGQKLDRLAVYVRAFPIHKGAGAAFELKQANQEG